MAKLQTRVFEFAPLYGYRSNADLARAMGVSEAQVSRVSRDVNGITENFIAGAKRAFPDKTLDDLFTVETEPAVA